MLINLWLTPTNNELKFDLPPIIFHRHQTIAITHLFIEWEKTVPHASLIVSSSLVDKSSTNPNQQLLFVYQKGNAKRLNYTPTQKDYYKIQCLELQASEFHIQPVDNSKLEKIERIFIQLSIIDERIQYLTS